MISLTTIEDSEIEPVVIHNDSESSFKSLRARVNRTATLDGGVVIVSQGTSDGDRTFDVRTRIDAEQETALWDLFTTQSLIHISTDIGFFIGMIESLRTDNGDLVLKLLVKEKLS